MNLKEINNITKIILILFSTVLLIAMCFIIKPDMYGDGQEYMLMTEAFENHFSPDVSINDINTATINYNFKFDLNREDKQYPFGFFISNEGKNYSYHFFLYSLFVMPIKVILGILNINQLRCFQIFNAIIYIFALWYIYIKIKICEKDKFFIIMQLICNPVLYYLVWTHAEVFTYSLVCISLALYVNKEYEKAIFIVSIAAMQNQPIIFLGGLYCLDYFLKVYIGNKEIYAKKFLYQIIRKGICFIPFFIPFLFYYINYGTFSLIVSSGYVKANGIANKINSLFFDLNQGILPFMPMLIIMFFIILVFGLLKKKLEVLLYIGTILMIMLGCSLQMNWNPGESGIMRYNVWITPILIYFVIIYKDSFIKIRFKKTFEKLIITSIFITTMIIICTGTFKYKYKHIEFNPLSKMVMNVFPSIYNPQEEIFAERALGMETDYYNKLPVIYSDESGYVKKVLMNNDSVNILLNELDCDNEIIKQKIEKYKNCTGLYYLNFNFEKIKLREDIKIEQENRKFKIKVFDTLTRLNVNKEYLLKTEITNLGAQIWESYKINKRYPIGISYHWLDADDNVVIHDGARTYFDESIYPNESKTINTKLLTPNVKGNYKLELDIVQENVSWFSDLNETKYIFDVIVD
ncbi:hypothetical protein BJV38_005598 [Clostridium beijerinckii]|uniref:hypothetical protein n=1 Tax=Clostridium beijerinckii TaxID=1520 RepID=UPI001570132D|nr:hypothetical protein [Clostridium beijerinckii]NRT37503.1 hypothetical protein [Clostridium beijerinckii]NRT48755.1 hypothetical protein [Clostridium beijerinckii]NRZ22949.1 hypothetical protein [Clostridium beijerinckii]